MEIEVPYDSLDDGIRETVRILAEAGDETFESCQCVPRFADCLTNASSKKWENLKAMLALYFAYNDFCRIHAGTHQWPN